MSALTIPRPSALLGKVRRVDEPKPRYRVEVRSIADGREQVTRTFAFFAKSAAHKQFQTLLDLGGRAYSSGRHRLVLIDTEGQR